MAFTAVRRRGDRLRPPLLRAGWKPVELLLDRFQDDRLGQAQAAPLNTGFARLAAFQRAGCIRQRRLHLFEVQEGGVPEKAEVGDVTEPFAQQFDEPAFVGRLMDFGECDVKVRPFILDPVNQEAQVGVGT